jgi:recombination protein RecR
MSKQILPRSLQQLIEAFSILPGVGERTAERYAYYLLKNDAARSLKLSESIKNLHGAIATCPITFALIDVQDGVSPLYSDSSRDKTTVAVVADPFDIVAFEKTGLFHGTYHVLGGLISPIDGIGPDQLRVRELLDRIKKDKVEEIIIATNAGVEGETTSLYVQNELKKSGVKVTRLARGLPVGIDIEYADQITLARALEGRQTF